MFSCKGAGIVIGGIFSLLFKRRTWPITLGAGIGLGMSYTSCENRFRSHYNKARKIVPKDLLPEIPDTLPNFGGLNAPSSESASSNDKTNASSAE